MLSLEWCKRVEIWKDELIKHYYTELGEIRLEGFTTFQQLSAEEAEKQSFHPFPPGTPWGAKWEYGWFRGEAVLPPEAEGQRIALWLEPGGESTVYVNGQTASCIRRNEDWQKINPVHLNRLTLQIQGVPGSSFHILLECYAGHGLRVAHVGPSPEGRVPLPEPPPQQTAVGRSTYGIWHESVYQLWLDVEALYQLRSKLDPLSLRVDRIDRGLREFTMTVDFELSFADFLDSVHKASEQLQPLLQDKNGSTAPLLYAFGHSHLDICYQWPLAEAGRKCARTWPTQMALMDEYPEYRFLLSQPCLYELAKKQYPEVYGRMAERVARGQVIPEGGMWVEADTNLISGESMIRQFLYGKGFIRREFGEDSKLLWLPDGFGFSGALPQVMRGCGVTCFSTAKLVSDFVRGEPFPWHTFTWKGIDGSAVQAAQHGNYSYQVSPHAAVGAWNKRTPQEGVSALLYPFGHGDGGGGPTRDHLEFFRRMKDLEGAPRMEMSHPTDLFRDLEGDEIWNAVYQGELYLKAHRGTYTTQAALKKGNRRCERALREAELWGAWAQWSGKLEYPADRMEEAWKAVLLNQFHDILPGSCIRRVAEEAADSYRLVEAEALDAAAEALGSLCAADSGKLTLFNSLSWERCALVELEPYLLTTHEVPLDEWQEWEGKLYMEAILPPVGWSGTEIGSRLLGEGQADASMSCPSTLRASAETAILENELIAAEFNRFGELIRLTDKSTGQNRIAGRSNVFRMYKDVPTFCDAWEIDSMYERQPVELEDEATVEVSAQGPLFAALRFTRRLNQSKLRQVVLLRRNSRMLEFQTEVDWHEKHKLLKVNFDTGIQAEEAVHDIQFGHIRRPARRSTPEAADRFEVCQHKWTALAEPNRGAAVLNNCKYGVSAAYGVIGLTLLKAPMAPDMLADQGHHTFTYAFMFWDGCIQNSGVIQAGYELNCPVLAARGEAGVESLLRLSTPNVIMEAVKPAEDGSGDLIIRLYEATGSQTRTQMTLAVEASQVLSCSMLEEPEGKAEATGQDIALEFHPFEIKTLRIVR